MVWFLTHCVIQVGIFFQIINEMGASIPWHELELPEGRTLKACQVMVDKEKTKIRKAKEAEGDSEAGPATPKTPALGKVGRSLVAHICSLLLMSVCRSVAPVSSMKRMSVKKKSKAHRKAKSKEPAKEDSGNVGGDGKGLVKYESADDDFV